VAALVHNLPACYGDMPDSVHFYNSNWSEYKVDFGRVPQEVMLSGRNLEQKRGGTEYTAGYGWSGDDHRDLTVLAPDGMDSLDFAKWNPYLDPWSADDDSLPIRKARNLEVAGKLTEAAAEFSKYPGETDTESFIRDRREVIAKGLTLHDKGVADYLKGTYLIQFGDAPKRDAGLALLYKLDVDERLKPNLAYALAASAPGTRAIKSDALLKVAHAYPDDPRAEPALVMAGRAMVERQMYEEAPVETLADGYKIFDELIRKYPKTRFRWSVYGWYGAREVRKKDTAAAMKWYVRQSTSPIPLQAYQAHLDLAKLALDDGRRDASLKHLILARHQQVGFRRHVWVTVTIERLPGSFTSKQANQFQSMVAKDPTVLEAYLDYRKEDTPLTPDAERQLLKFASRSASRFRASHPGVLARIAQMQYDLGDYGSSLTTAREATSGSKDVRGRTIYAAAASLARLGRYGEAIRAYTRLWDSQPAPYLKTACGEALAVLHERYGDPVKAYHIYRDIGYQRDLAFMADSGLTIDQLRRAVQRYRGEERLCYDFTLAMRYFRAERYAEAERLLVKVGPATRIFRGAWTNLGDGYWETTSVEPRPGTIGPPGPPDVLTDVRAMATLRHKASTAAKADDRAQAMYDMGKYVYDRESLLFYSAGMWRLGRADTYSLYWNPDTNKGEPERQAVATGHEHECYSQAMRHFEEVFHDYPRSPAAPKALYMAAICAEKFSHLNSWWREHSGPERAKASAYMARLTKEFPGHELAKPAAKFADEYKSLLKPDFE